MEYEVTVGNNKYKISFISTLVLVLFFLFTAQTNLFGVDSEAQNSINSLSIEVMDEEQNILFRTEPWRIGVTEILLNIKNPKSDDYLVFDYLNTLLLEQIKLFNFHLLDEKEVEYLLQLSLDNIKNEVVYDDELFSRVYNNSMAFLRNQKEIILADTSSYEKYQEESIIDSGRIPVTIVTKDKGQKFPFLSYSDKVKSLVISKESLLESIISIELDKIGNVYIYRMFKFSPEISDPIMLTEFSFTKNTLHTIDTKTLDALSLGIGGYIRSILEIETDVPDVQVLIDNELYSISDNGLNVLPPGEYEIVISSKKTGYYDKNIYQLESGKATLIKPIISFPSEALFSLSIYPFNADIIVESQKIISNPAEMRGGLSDQVSLFSEAGGYLPQNMVISHKVSSESPFNLHLRPKWMGLDSEINYGQFSFYKSLSAAILSLPASVLLYGLVSEYNYPVYEAALGVSLAINISLLLDTIISLVDYYHRTEVL